MRRTCRAVLDEVTAFGTVPEEFMQELTTDARLMIGLHMLGGEPLAALEVAERVALEAQITSKPMLGWRTLGLLGGICETVEELAPERVAALRAHVGRAAAAMTVDSPVAEAYRSVSPATTTPRPPPGSGSAAPSPRRSRCSTGTDGGRHR